MRATLEIYFRTVTTGSMFQWQNGLQNLLICVTSLTCSTNSICHFRGKQLCSGQEIKWLHSNPHQNYGGNEWTLGISDMFQTLADFERDWARASFLPADEWSPCSFQEFEQYFPTTEDPQIGKEWILNPFVKKPGVLTLSNRIWLFSNARKGLTAWDQKWWWP